MGSLGRQEWRRGIVIGAVLTACGILWILLGLPHGIPPFPADWHPATKFVIAISIVFWALLFLVFCVIRYYSKSRYRLPLDREMRLLTYLILGICAGVFFTWVYALQIFWLPGSVSDSSMVWGLVPESSFNMGCTLLTMQLVPFFALHSVYYVGKMADAVNTR